METANSGFQVIFRIGRKPTIRDLHFMSLLNTVRTFDLPEQQYTEEGIGIYAFDLYRKLSGKADLSFAEFLNLNLKVDHWNAKKEFPVSISEKIARKSGLFNYRSQFICWVSSEILQGFQDERLSDVDTAEQCLQVTLDLNNTLDLNKLVEAWVKAGAPESWNNKSD